jgi:hypothetical protein
MINHTKRYWRVYLLLADLIAIWFSSNQHDRLNYEFWDAVINQQPLPDPTGGMTHLLTGVGLFLALLILIGSFYARPIGGPKRPIGKELWDGVKIVLGIVGLVGGAAVYLQIGASFPDFNRWWVQLLTWLGLMLVLFVMLWLNGPRSIRGQNRRS